jgi:hypothetical protein
MPAYKLTYFDARGIAEMTRLLFAAAGVKYEDCRVTREQFEELKASKFKYIGMGYMLKYTILFIYIQWVELIMHSNNAAVEVT